MFPGRQAHMTPDRAFAGPNTEPVAGDDGEAKRTVMRMIDELELDAVDVGPLFNARYVEAMAPLYVHMNFFKRPDGGFEYAFTSSGN